MLLKPGNEVIVAEQALGLAGVQHFVGYAVL
jgi:hypothetical protein